MPFSRGASFHPARTAGEGHGQTWSYAHDVEDNLASITDPLTAVETNGFDALNRLVSTVDRGAFTTTKAYNAADQLTGYTDPRSLTTDFAYNGFGEVIVETSPDRGTLSYAYNTRGLPVSRTDARGLTLAYSYDNGGRLTAIDYPGGTAQDLVFTHDIEPWAGLGASSGKGRLARVADSVLRSDFGYTTTTSGSQIEERRFYPNGRQYDTTASHDLEGNLTALRYPVSNDRLYFDRDGDGRVTRIRLQLAGSGPDITLIDSVTYRPNGPLATLAYGDGFTQTRTYDASYRLTGITDGNGSTTLRQLGYTHDSRDNLTAITDALAPANDESFSYIARAHLSGATGPYGAFAFTYDGVGNRLSHSRDSGGGAQVDSYAYPASSNRLASVALAAGGTRSLGYDAAGNVISDSRAGGPFGYSYDAAGRLASVSVGGVVQAEYRYNHLGQQVVRTFPGSGQSIHAVHGPDGNRIAELDGGTGALIREYVWLDGAPVAVIEGGQVYLVRTDHIGRPSFATTAAGTVVWTASYLPFGGVHVTTGAPIEARFPGQWFQAESGLHQNWMRDYDPTTGRYLEPDPLGLVDGASVYGYARQNPGRWVDRMGLEAWDLDGRGNTSACSYYQSMSSQNPECNYYKAAYEICMGDRGTVNALTDMGIVDAWLRGKTSSSQSEIYDGIRETLIFYDKMSRSAEYIDQCGCTTGDIIDIYHRIAFSKNGLSTLWYGGDRIPNGWPGNPVPATSR